VRSIPSSLDSAIVAEIDARLARVATEHDVTVPWAIESGSRAWGFPSPDSDYDCRFLYVSRPERYLSLWHARDVIETPLDKIFDVNGWDLSKALRLLVKGNATPIEWLRSPIIYSGDNEFRDELLEVATAVVDPVLLVRHYLHVGHHQWSGWDDSMALKKVFYSLRPASSLRWLRVNPGGIPPMELTALLREGDAPDAVVQEAVDLIALKAVTHELGTGQAPPAIRAFIVDEFERASRADDVPPQPRAMATQIADAFFRRTIAR
jgi:predicted nucleotidyltransferase